MPYADRAKQNEYQRNWMRKRREEFFAGKSCATCGTQEDLELDHLDPKAKITHRIWSWSEKRRLMELAKCQVLCKEHHKQKSDQQLRTAVHGTTWMYDRYGCRCSDCREAKSKRNASRKR